MSLTLHQLQLFERFTQIDGIAGQEVAVASALRAIYEGLGFEIISDNLGSVVAHKPSKNPNAIKVLVVGHMDEVGFIVTDICPNGMIKCDPVGGLNPQTLLASRVRLKIGPNQFVSGSIDAVPPHLMKEEDRDHPVKIDQMLFDFGFRSKQEALTSGVNIGQMVVVEGPLTILNNGQRLLAKAFDNRYGIVLGIDVLEELKEINLDIDLYVGATVQEEVGTRGAATLAHKIHPDLAIVLDCSPARDSTGVKSELGQLGGGVLIRFYDRSMIAFPELLDYQKLAADQVGVKYQYFDSPGGTDAGAIHLKYDGILTLTHCICARNIHTAASVIDTDDYQAARSSLIYMLKDLNRDQLVKWAEARR
ncbi:MAG: M42 family metallopeptidase [Bacilli bacterium]|jgi:glutamyl aminopeptidase|nr:M42 family metallopeptidase [Bacilli bacterium]MDD4344556.1 M42 family metallopeptidase [Bacilli bacterium]MDD4520450.1 M42 family metallopeptidase [Bacilli bacterium]MDY0399135.1 M42 family metallopeptidase [Bacilli bacterium]HKM11208.1 M42 family metallopeptidase [Bacilli bacterium]